MKKKIVLIELALVVLALAFAGCTTDQSTLAFRSEKMAADSTAAAVSSFNAYYSTATNGASFQKVTELNKQRDQVYEASRKTADVLKVAEAARLQYASNSTPANQAALQSAMSLVSANSGSVTSAVAAAMSPSPFSTLQP